MDDLISRKELLSRTIYNPLHAPYITKQDVENMPSAQLEHLTDDDFETIRIHLNALKEKLCNQRRWKEAEEYQRIIDRFMSFVSSQPEQTGKWIYDGDCYICNKCKSAFNWWADSQCSNFCPECGADMRGEQND